MFLKPGVEVVEETPGAGAVAARGRRVTIRSSCCLNRGDAVDPERVESFQLSRSQLMPGLVYALEGMRVGGRRRVRISPHLAYGEQGVPDRIPPDAVLVFDLELIGVD